MAPPSSFFLWFYCFAWLSSSNLGSWASSGESPITASPQSEPEAAPCSSLQPVGGGHSSGLLPPLFKVLSGHGRGPSRPQPDPRALRYMKKLYKTYATKEGIPKSTRSHLYNTVRLFTPCLPPKSTSGDRHPGTGLSPPADLLFSLGRVAAVEHLLKSVLLYTLDSAVAPPAAVTCACSLAAAGPQTRGEAAPGAPSASRLELGEGRRWVELDVTALLRPLLAARESSVRLRANCSCPAGPLRAPPALLLYLNDTSARGAEAPGPGPERPRAAACPAGEGPRGARRGRAARGTARPAPPPAGECELHDFRLGFRQLGWDGWIVAPRGYNPRYCGGACPRAVRQRYGSALHTVVQSVVRERLDAAVPPPSCVPAAYRPLSVLAVEPDASIAYKEYGDMVATRCTCR